jgi:hypothetical protein
MKMKKALLSALVLASGSVSALDNTISNEFWDCRLYTNSVSNCSTGILEGAVLNTHSLTQKESTALPIFDPKRRFGVVIVFK